MAYSDIDKPSDYFNTITYSGDGISPKSITGVGFQPDWVWVKRRNGTTPHVLYDAVRGTGKQLISNDTSAEATNNQYGYISAFESDGYEVTEGSTSITRVNGSGGTYVAWNWLGANGTSANTDGSISSTVSANTTAGFSIVSYTGTGSNETIGHGLGKAPDITFTKSRTNVEDWICYFTIVDGSMDYMKLNKTDAALGSGAVFTSTTFSKADSSSEEIIAYCFTSIKGYSKFGSYTGNGNADGPFVYTGFKPAMVILKRTDSADSWTIRDNKRDVDNVVTQLLYPDLSNAEATAASNNYLDIVSNGFKLRATSGQVNGSGGTYIYMAFAEHPFVSSTGTPVTAR